MLADQHGGGGADRRHVQRTADVPGRARVARRAHDVVPHGVSVNLAARREARVEVGRRLVNLLQRDVGG